MKIMRPMLILSLAAATTGSALQAGATAPVFTTMQKIQAAGLGLGLAGVGFYCFGKGLDAMGTVAETVVAPGIDTIRRSGAYQRTVGRFFRKPSANSSLKDIPKDLKKNVYILSSIALSALVSHTLDLPKTLMPYLVVSA